MRYSKDESAYILAEFNSGDSVTFDAYRLTDDFLTVSGVSVSEIASTGTFKYLFDTTVTEKTEFLLIMSNGSIDKRGKLVLGGYPDDIEELLESVEIDVAFIKEIEGGRWKINKSTNRMTFYESDNTTVAAEFNLFDSNGAAATANVFERVPV